MHKKDSEESRYFRAPFGALHLGEGMFLLLYGKKLEEAGVEGYNTLEEYRARRRAPTPHPKKPPEKVKIPEPMPPLRKPGIELGKNLEDVLSHEKLKFTPKQLWEELDKYVVGQEEAKRAVATAVYKHYARLNSDDPSSISKSNVLLYGPSGSGKTYLVQCLAEIMRTPLVIADATKLTATGYVGDTPEDIINRLVASVGGNIEEAEKGIVFIDEVDKLAGSGDRAAVATTKAQQELLRLLEGAVVETEYGRLRTDNILFICAGAFEGDPASGVPSLEERVMQRLGEKEKRRIGFYSTREESKNQGLDYNKLLEHVTEDDLKEYGLIPELIGRLDVRVGLNKLTREELRKILTEPVNAPLKSTQNFFAEDGINIILEENALKYIADWAYSKGLGARGLKSALAKIEQKYAHLIGTDVQEIRIREEDVKGYLTFHG